MALILTAPTNPGTSSWSDADTVTTSGGVKFLKKRVQLADIQVSAGTANIAFGSALPAGSVVIGGAVFVTDAMDGGGVTTGEFRVINNTNTAGYGLLETVGVAAGFQTPLENLATSGSVIIDPTLASYTPRVLVTADVDLDQLTDFDMTGYLFYVVPTGLTAP